MSRDTGEGIGSIWLINWTGGLGLGLASNRPSTCEGRIWRGRSVRIRFSIQLHVIAATKAHELYQRVRRVGPF